MMKRKIVYIPVAQIEREKRLLHRAEHFEAFCLLVGGKKRQPGTKQEVPIKRCTRRYNALVIGRARPWLLYIGWMVYVAPGIKFHGL